MSYPILGTFLLQRKHKLEAFTKRIAPSLPMVKGLLAQDKMYRATQKPAMVQIEC